MILTEAIAGLVGIADSYNVVVLEANGLQARCDHLAILVGIGKRTDLARVGSKSRASPRRQAMPRIGAVTKTNLSNQRGPAHRIMPQA